MLYTLDPSMPAVQGAWEITARDHHDVYSGHVNVDIGDLLDLTADLRIILGLEEGGLTAAPCRGLSLTVATSAPVACST
ncbi:MAG: hypothetical protein IPM08_14880 [Actinomycetales bacterium]|nr:hypothetical protein [Actinomycetales bacterium]